jgi:hypothetical protein
MKTRKFYRLAFGLILVYATVVHSHPTLAREKWPQATEEAKQELAAMKQHEEDVWKRVEPEVVAWAKKGKPFIPAASKPSDLPQATVPAFPGAEGGGKFSFGGRGGKVFVVTSLEDSGPGTLREAVESAGPRIVVFNVAGIIRLKMPILALAPYLTIAGQTAPGDGICIAGNSLRVNTHDVVLRYLKFRRGNTNVFDRESCVCGNPVGNIIIDHCSASWGNDQTLDTYRHMYQPTNGGAAQKLPTVNDTIQWCLITEALDLNNHAFGGDWGGRNTAFHHNLFACNTGRNPSIAMTYDFNFVNNVLFNWRHRSVDGGDERSLINCINNYYKPGPATLDNPVRYRVVEPAASWSKANPVGRWGKAYVAGNVVEGYPNVTADNWAGGVQFSATPDPQADGSIAKGLIDHPEKLKEIINKVRVDQPFPMPPVTMTSAQEAYGAVLENAGATLPKRDAIDERAVRQTRTGEVEYKKGKGIITDISQVGGYPEYKGEPAKDVGPDGIPLWWKQKYHLDWKDAMLASKDLDGDGYTVIEKYLNGLAPGKKIDWNEPKANENTLTVSSFLTARQ